MRPFVLNKTFVYKVNEGLSGKFGKTEKDLRSDLSGETGTDTAKIQRGVLS